MPRVYAPVSGDDVTQLLREGECRPVAVFGVDTRLREALPDLDDEELEHLATQFAAAAAQHDPVAVGVFEAPAQSVAPHTSPDAAPGQFTVEGALRHRDLVCFLVADPGETVSDDADLELSWYDATELGTVRDLLGGSNQL